MASVIKVSEILHPTANVPSLTINSDSTVSFDAGILNVTGPINGVIGANTPYSGTFTSLNNSGNLTFTGTGNRITGDFSNATVANRVAFQTSTTNSGTNLLAIANGTATQSAFRFYNSSDVTTNQFAHFGCSATETFVKSESTSGTYLPMTFYTGGSEAMRITTDRNVGIGTASPSGKLDVIGSNATASDWGNVNITSRNVINLANRIYTGLRLQDSGSSDAGAIGYSYNGTGYNMMFATVPSVGGALTERMRITSAGDVGIGRTSPGAKLDVGADGAGEGLVAQFTRFTSGTGIHGLYVATNVTDRYVKFSSSGTNSGDFRFFTGNDERMRLNTGGQLSIGSGGTSIGNLTVRNTGGVTTATLQHDGGSSFGTILTLETISGTDDPVLGFKNFNGGSPKYYGIGCRDNGSLAFISGASIGGFGDERMRLTETGQLRIGTTSYTATNEATVAIVSSAIAAVGWNTRNLLLQHGSQPGIGFLCTDNSSTAVFKLWGGTTIFECRNGSDNGFISIAASGFPVSSDYRIKTDVNEFDSVLSKIMNLRPVNYVKDGSQGREFGFIAHEASEQFSDLVHGEKDAMRNDNSMEIQTFNYNGLTAVLTKAIQELKSIIDQQDARIKTLEGNV